MTLEQNVEKYVKLYKEYKENNAILELIKEQVKTHYEEQDEKMLKVNGMVAVTKSRKEITYNPKIYEFLDNVGLLPHVAKVSPTLEKYYNLEKARINEKVILKLYTGNKAIIDRESISEDHSYFESMGLEELSNSFNQYYTKDKLLESEVESLKNSILENLNVDSLRCELGTLKRTVNFEYDPSVIFDGVSGKKEILIKEVENVGYNIEVYPDEAIATVSYTDKIGNYFVEELFENGLSSDIESTFLKKRPLKQKLKDGYVFSKFEIEMDPYEFFSGCKLTKGKINEFVDDGLISEEELKEFIDDETISYHVEVLNEGAMESQMKVFRDKMNNKIQRYRMRTEESYVPQPIIYNDTQPIVNLDDDVNF